MHAIPAGTIRKTGMTPVQLASQRPLAGIPVAVSRTLQWMWGFYVRRFDPEKRFLSHLVLIVFVSGIAADWACSASSMQPPKTHCKKSRHVDDGTPKPVSGSCHVRSCHACAATLFLLPDSPSRRLQNGQRHLLPVTESTSPSTIPADQQWFNWRGGMPEGPSSLSPPSLFLVHCTIIC